MTSSLSTSTDLRAHALSSLSCQAAALTPAEASSALACIPRRAGTGAGGVPLPPSSALAALAGGRTAADLLASEASSTRVISFCADLDHLLGGGVVFGQVTEFCESRGLVGARGESAALVPFLSRRKHTLSFPFSLSLSLSCFTHRRRPRHRQDPAVHAAVHGRPDPGVVWRSWRAGGLYR